MPSLHKFRLFPKIDYPPPAFEDVEGLPWCSPRDKAHVINLSVYNAKENQVALWDAVATVLYKINPEKLKDLLNLEKENFEFECLAQDDVGGEVEVWKVLRTHHRVLICAALQSKQIDKVYWNPIIRCEIDPSGAWKLDCKFKSTTDAKLNYLLQYNHQELKNDDSFKGKLVKDEGTLLRKADKLSKRLLEAESWNNSTFEHKFLY